MQGSRSERVGRRGIEPRTRGLKDDPRDVHGGPLVPILAVPSIRVVHHCARASRSVHWRGCHRGCHSGTALGATEGALTALSDARRKRWATRQVDQGDDVHDRMEKASMRRPPHVAHPDDMEW